MSAGGRTGTRSRTPANAVPGDPAASAPEPAPRQAAGWGRVIGMLAPGAAVDRASAAGTATATPPAQSGTDRAGFGHPVARIARPGNPRAPSREMSVDASPGDLESAVKPLWLRAQSGDDAAYRQALSLLATRVRGYLKRRLSGLPDEVEDLVQETLLALHLQRGTYDPTLPVSAWAAAIARHKLVDLWRRRGRRDNLHDALDDVDEQLLADVPEEAGTRRDLEALFEELPPAQRQAIALTKLEGLSVAEVAARTGTSESAIKVQVHRGLKRLSALVRKGS